MKVRHLALAGLGILFATTSSTYAHAQKRATLHGALAATDAASFEVYLPQQHKAELAQLLVDLQNPNSSSYHQWLTPAQFQARFALSDAKVNAIVSQLTSLGLSVTKASPQLLEVSGTAAQVTAALGTPLSHGTRSDGKAVVVATSQLNLPGSLSGVGAVVTGLSGTLRMHTEARPHAVPQNRTAPTGGYWFDDLKQAYTFPSYKDYAGNGSTIGILIPSGYSQADMDAYFGHEGVATPKIRVEKVLGGAPFDPASDSSFEAELDVQQSGGMAPKAKIVMYSVPDLSDESIIAGLVQIVEDNTVDVVNMSFGGPELAYAPAYNGGEDFSGILVAEDEVMAEGNALGITFVASSGDYGADTVPPLACFEAPGPCGSFQPSVEFPASSPHVTGVGGTNLHTTFDVSQPGDLNSAYLSEEAYADPISGDALYGTAATGLFWGSGGGDSIVFSKPDYQKLVKTGNAKMRTVPDLALHMGGCPGEPAPYTVTCSPDDSYDLEVFGGKLVGVIGTSASSPDFAGLTALNIQRTGGRVGNENTYIYTLASQQTPNSPNPVFHWGIPGFNGLYSSGNQGYNRVLGNGTLLGKDFINAPLIPSAGIPQTPSNP